MNIKDFFIAIVVGIVLSLCFQRYIFTPYISSGQTTFTTVDLQRNEVLNREIDFIDYQQSLVSVKRTELEVSWGSLLFSTEGGTLERLDIKREHHGQSKYMRTTAPLESFAQQARSFLVAFADATPYMYELIQHTTDNTYERLVYRASMNGDVIEKTFIVYKENPVIDLNIRVIAQNGQSIYKPRILLRAPSLGTTLDEDVISGVVINNQGSFAKKMMERIPQEQGWIRPQLFGVDDRYFVHAFLKDNGLLEKGYYTLFNQKQYGFFVEAAEQKGSFEWKTTFFVGPKELDVIKTVDSRLEQTVDYSGWFVHISKGLLWLLKLLFSYVHNYGFAIILLTLLLKLLLLPLTLSTDVTMKKQKEVQKKLAYIQQKYKDDADLLARERAEIIRKHGVPGIGGCLPVLLQIPIFIALSRLLNSSIELYQAPMLWIPDLSVRDPWYILPIIITLSMLASAVNADDKQKLSIIAMAFIFGAFTANFAAGLALYIAINTLFGIFQAYITRFIKA